MRFTKAQIRGVRGQLTVLAVVYAGGLTLAVASILLRGVFFERYARENHADLPERLLPVVRALAQEQPPEETLAALPADDVRLLYGNWINAPERVDEVFFAKNLCTARGDLILSALRRTLAVGSPGQRSRAMAMLRFVEQPSLRSGCRQLWQYALLRAQQRGEAKLAGQAQAGLDACSPLDP